MGNYLSKFPNIASVGSVCINNNQLKGGIININQHMNSLGFKFDDIYRILTPVNDRFPSCASDLRIEKGLGVKTNSFLFKRGVKL